MRLPLCFRSYQVIEEGKYHHNNISYSRSSSKVRFVEISMVVIILGVSKLDIELFFS